MTTQRWGNHILIAEFRWRRLALRCLVHGTQATWQAVTDMWQKTSSRIAQTECTHPQELRVRGANLWASMDVCDRKTRMMWRHPRLISHSCGMCTERSKNQSESKSEGQCQHQSESGTDHQWSVGRKREEQHLPKVRPRALCVSNRCRARLALSRMGHCWDAVYIDQGVSRRGRQFHREKYQPYRRWRFGDWLWWPKRCSTRRLENEYATRTRQWISKSNSQQRLDSSDASLDVQPRVGAGTLRSVAFPSSTLPTSPESTTARSVIEPGVVADVPALRRGRQIRWGPVEHGYANGSDRCVVAKCTNRCFI